MIRKFVEFFVFSNIFLALCVVALCIETNLLLHLPLNYCGFYFFVFGAALVQYNLHYLLKTSSSANSLRLIWSKKNISTHLFIISAGVVLLISGLFTFNAQQILVIGVLGIIAFLYSFPVLPFANKKRIKDFGILKIAALSISWTIVTVWFPAAGAQHTSVSFLIIFLRRFIFIFSLCIAFDIRDMDVDSKENIRTIPIIAGVKKAYYLTVILLIIFALLSVIEYIRAPDIKLLTAMLISAAVTFCMINYTQKKRSDLAYIICLDGMMLLQAILVIIGSV